MRVLWAVPDPPPDADGAESLGACRGLTRDAEEVLMSIANGEYGPAAARAASLLGAGPPPRVGAG